MIKLRDYQESIVKAISAEYRTGHKRVLAQVPTGGGKTAIYSYICNAMKSKSKSVIVLTHRKELLEQGSQSLYRMGVEHGYIASGIKEKMQGVMMASVGTLLSRIKSGRPYKEPDLIIIDEAHHAVASQWRTITANFPNSRILGVTATPIRTDGKGLDSVFDSIVLGDDHGASVKELIRRGFLSPYTCNIQEIAFDAQVARVVNGDYDAKSLAASIEGYIGCEVEQYRKTLHNRPTIAFYPDIKTAQKACQKFIESGYKAVCVDGKMKPSERKKAIQGLADGSVHVLLSCEIVSEGTDIPVVEGIIMMRKTLSMALFLQQAGRGLRVCEGKTHAIINDHVGNIALHGMPCDDRKWSLQGVVRSKRTREITERITQCDRCKTHFLTADRICPECHWEIEATERRKAIMVDGELVSVSPEDFEKYKQAKQEEAKKERQQAQTLQELIALGVSRNYRNPRAWAEHIYNSRLNKRKW